jgi:hypothetical protein
MDDGGNLELVDHGDVQSLPFAYPDCRAHQLAAIAHDGAADTIGTGPKGIHTEAFPWSRQLKDRPLDHSLPQGLTHLDRRQNGQTQAKVSQKMTPIHGGNGGLQPGPQSTGTTKNLEVRPSQQTCTLSLLL